MAQFSVTGRNAMLSALATAIGSSATFKVYSGAMPANCAAARTGTVLASASLPATPFATPSGGVMGLSGTWSDPAADSSGLGGYFTIADGSSVAHFQDLISQPWTASTAWILNQQVNNGTNVYKCTTAGTSAASGGPTGTGSGISDGSAVWAYVGPVGMVLDNSNLAVGQVFTVASFNITAGNA